MSCTINSGPFSEHDIFELVIGLCPSTHGRGYWKLNTSLLNDNIYVDLIKNVISDTVRIECDCSPTLLWDTIKCRVRGETIKYASIKKKKQTIDINFYKTQIRILENRFVLTPSHELRIKIQKLKDDFELLIRTRTLGAIIRSRARWIES